MNSTPTANRLQIGIFGKPNTGKSSLINAIVKQDIAIVSNIQGTTTDPVFKAIEIPGIGPCTLIDTAGYKDNTQLNNLRINRTLDIIKRCDITILVINDKMDKQEKELYNKLNKTSKCIIAYNNIYNNITNIKDKDMVVIDAKNNYNIDLLIEEIAKVIPKDYNNITIFNNINNKDIVMLVIPQDKEAPKGRLILPQVQTIRELLDDKAIVICTTLDTYEESLHILRSDPKMIICDSSIFKEVYKYKPSNSLLTSFSILFANYKGDINYFIDSTIALDSLNYNSRVLIVEACTHTSINEDIGRVKIPKLLRDKYGSSITIDFVNGINFPSIIDYDVVIHCGACMFNRSYVMNRVNVCKEQGIPMLNYGIVIAYLNDILQFCYINKENNMLK
ncbi:MAG: [FeFe] hydrogenase H-cluster maturation GTPase HydF [Erysipelotrichaceae bacterium]